MTGTGDTWRVPSPPEIDGATVASAGQTRLLGVMSDYEVEKALIYRIERMGGDEARRWLVRMGRGA